jgi:hypothetical protein
MNPDTWKLIASIGGVLLTVVTGPIIWAMRAEAGKIRTEMALLRTELKAEIQASQTALEKQMTLVDWRLGKEMTDMETRLNQRIDTRLVHR